MKLLVLGVAFAALASTSPIVPRDNGVYTDVVWFTVEKIVTVTASQLAPTTVPISVADSPGYNHVSISDVRHHHEPSHLSSTTVSRSTIQEPASSKQASSAAAPPASSPSLASNSPGIAACHSNPTTYQAKVLDAHNCHRANNSAPAVSWDDALAATAQKIAETCIYAHSMDVDGGGYGQNIAAGTEAARVDWIITEGFYNGEVNAYPEASYGADNPDMTHFKSWGHYSQVVWKSTTHAVCYTKDCTGSGKGPKGLEGVTADCTPFFTVCNYKGPGNFGGEYGKNVGRPKGYATVHGKGWKPPK
ncbi:PR-1-like protein [Mytilinidion resinicola]|uniref:PR-1-like protein n=1 Tax=Mytilinidion resinicola TaxID=574789 RepID=A0A6A6XYP5_9PEZI|nr:PR-1-like protein [Mytilinidion resinicola]KAF2801373.1 PR-1-like protein [Mytilinidion resinicola]